MGAERTPRVEAKNHPSCSPRAPRKPGTSGHTVPPVVALARAWGGGVEDAQCTQLLKSLSISGFRAVQKCLLAAATGPPAPRTVDFLFKNRESPASFRDYGARRGIHGVRRRDHVIRRWRHGMSRRHCSFVPELPEARYAPQSHPRHCAIPRPPPFAIPLASRLPAHRSSSGERGGGDDDACDAELPPASCEDSRAVVAAARRTATKE